MNKLISVVAIAGMLAIPSTKADIAGFEVGGYQWTPDYKGILQSSTETQLGSQIDLVEDLGFTDDDNTVIWFTLEHPIPMLPNFKLVSSDLESSASNILTREVEFGGETYSVSENVTTVIDSSNMEYTFYYEILDNWVNLDVGATIRQYDGLVSLTTPSDGSNISESEPLDFTIPLLYAKARVDLPFTGFFVDGSVNIISYDDESVSDITVALGYESDIGLGASLGYRTFDLEADEKNLFVDMQFDGMYLSAFFHF